MKDVYRPFAERKRMTRLGEAVAKALRRGKRPLVEDHNIWEILLQIYQERSVAYLRGDAPTLSTLARVKDLLRSERIISRDHDYARVWRVNELPDVQADEAVCLLDEGTCVSHLSAMQKFNLTERRPQTLFLTVATNDTWRELVELPDEADEEAPLRQRRHHPEVVRSRQLDIFQTKSFPRTTQLKSSVVRVTEIGETFLHMLEQSERCGGMSHVLDVYGKHAATYLPQIVRRIDRADAKLTKVRAGYILTEMLGLKNEVAEGWIKFAQRGGSQRLDPKAPYKPTFSERWMLSLNV
jgi:predicted transcriptional regulator of viral defense system